MKSWIDTYFGLFLKLFDDTVSVGRDFSVRIVNHIAGWSGSTFWFPASFSSPPCREWLWDTPSLLSSGYQGLSLGVKRPGREADHSPLSSAKVKEWVELYLHSPSMPSWHGAQLKHRENFTFAKIWSKFSMNWRHVLKQTWNTGLSVHMYTLSSWTYSCTPTMYRFKKIANGMTFITHK
jgi:hypothetical protein